MTYAVFCLKTSCNAEKWDESRYDEKTSSFPPFRYLGTSHWSTKLLFQDSRWLDMWLGSPQSRCYLGRSLGIVAQRTSHTSCTLRHILKWECPQQNACCAVYGLVITNSAIKKLRKKSQWNICWLPMLNNSVTTTKAVSCHRDHRKLKERSACLHKRGTFKSTLSVKRFSLLIFFEKRVSVYCFHIHYEDDRAVFKIPLTTSKEQSKLQCKEIFSSTISSIPIAWWWLQSL